MKKTFTKFFATAAAVSMLASVSAVVNADEAAIAFETATIDAGVIITGVTNGDDAAEIEIPAEIDGKAVVGVADYAFADLDNLAVIYVPASVTAENTENVAFMTKASFDAYVAANLPEEATKADLIAYIAAKLEYAGKAEGHTEAELAEVEAKIMKKAELAGVTLTEDMDEAAIVEAMITMLQNKEAMALTAATNDKLTVWESTVTYTATTVIAEGENLKAYLDARKPLGLSITMFGDANADGKITVRDAAAIAAGLANSNVDELPGNGDYNRDGSVTVRDAAKIASDLAHGLL